MKRLIMMGMCVSGFACGGYEVENVVDLEGPAPGEVRVEADAEGTAKLVFHQGNAANRWLNINLTRNGAPPTSGPACNWTYSSCDRISNDAAGVVTISGLCVGTYTISLVDIYDSAAADCSNPDDLRATCDTGSVTLLPTTDATYAPDCRVPAAANLIVDPDCLDGC